MKPQVADCDDLEVGTLVRFVGTQLAPESDIGIVIKLPADPREYIGIKWIRDGLCQHNTTGMDDAFYQGHLEIVK
jgi:hypothetical protein